MRRALVRRVFKQRPKRLLLRARNSSLTVFGILDQVRFDVLIYVDGIKLPNSLGDRLPRMSVIFSREVDGRGFPTLLTSELVASLQEVVDGYNAQSGCPEHICMTLRWRSRCVYRELGFFFFDETENEGTVAHPLKG